MNYEIFAPLSNFDWEGSRREFMQGVNIVNLNEAPDLTAFHQCLSICEIEMLEQVLFWVLIEKSGNNVVSPSEIINLILLALWLVKPTKAHVKVRFSHIEGERHEISRHLDRFDYLPDMVEDHFIDSELKQAARWYQTMYSIRR